jgi:hypothetical protein
MLISLKCYGINKYNFYNTMNNYVLSYDNNNYNIMCFYYQLNNDIKNLMLRWSRKEDNYE